MEAYFLANKERIESVLKFSEVKFQNDEVVININSEYFILAIHELKNNSLLQAQCFIGAFGVHYPHKEKEFQVEYLFCSLTLNIRYRVQVSLENKEKIPSIHQYFEGATWYEREIFDMFGIEFINAADNRRILSDYNFTHHPLLKDFPVTGYTEVRYNPITHSIEESAINLAQEYRDFEFEMPWNTEILQQQIKKI